MSGSSQDASLSSGSSKDEEDSMWESAPPSPPPLPANDLMSRMGGNSMDCWDYTLELDCLRGPEGYSFYFILAPFFLLLSNTCVGLSNPI